MFSNIPKTISYFLLGAMLLLISFHYSCLNYQEVEIVEMGKIDVENLTAKGVDLNINIKIKNPNNYKISIVNSDLDIYIKDAKAGKAIIDNNIVIPKKSEEVHHIKVSAKFTNMLTGTLRLLTSFFGSPSVKVKVQGVIKVKAKGLTKKIPVEFEEEVEL